MLDSRLVLAGSQGAGVLVQYARQVPFHEPTSVKVGKAPLDHDRALVLGVWIAKYISNPDVAPF